MDPYGKKELIEFYDRHLGDFGDHPQAVRWTPEGQMARYGAFLEIMGDIRGRALLDFGCGKGDFCGFLRHRGVDCRYLGMDINERLIGLAGKKFPGAAFMALDIEETMPPEEFDIVMACGVFNLRVGGIAETMRNVLKRLFSLCREAMHFNVLSDETPLKDVELFYVDPDEMAAFVRRELSARMIMRRDLVPGDLFISVYR